MINAITGYLSNIAGTALISGAIISVAGKGPAATVCKTAGALILIASVAVPFKNINLDFVLDSNFTNNQLNYTLSDTQNQARQLQNSVVGDKLEEYAQKQAKNLGVDVEIDMSTYCDENNMFYIKSVTAIYKDEQSYAKRGLVEKILTEECGIQSETQQHCYE